MRTLIAYYSRRGQNLVNGMVQTLKVGNTERMATILQKITGADCLRIEPAIDYPKDYCQCIDLARQDLLRNIRPALNNSPDTIKNYDLIYLGYPIWWHTAPMAIDTFLESYDLNGKVVLPFCTSGGSSIEESMPDIRSLGQSRGASVGNGLTANTLNRDVITEWLRGNGVF